ncbi:hypothetical protein D3C80_1654120 [compost metagenome]
MQQCEFFSFLDARLHPSVMQARVAYEGLHYGAQGRLVAKHQGKHAEVGQASCFCQQQAKGFLAR